MTDPRDAGDESARPDLAPLLPHGASLFAELPVRAVVLTALGPVVDAGVLRVRGSHASAVILVRAGQLADSHLFTARERHSGPWVIAQVQGWTDAVVTAERFGPQQMDLAGSLLHGELIYDDLRLEWTDWSGLLDDLGGRGGGYLVELDSHSGRAVTCIVEGRQANTYTDADPSVDDPALLEAMARSGRGHIRVRMLGISAPWVITPSAGSAGVGVHTDSASDAAPTTPAVSPEPEGQPASTAEHSSWSSASVAEHSSWSSPTGEPGDAHAPASSPQVDQDAPLAAEAADARRPELDVDDELTIAPGISVLLPDLSWVAPWQAAWREPTGAPTSAATAPGSVPADDSVGADPANGNAPAVADAGELSGVTSLAGRPRQGDAAPSSQSVSALRAELHDIAQRWLQLSSSRVDSLLEVAAIHDIPLDQTLHDLRGLSIRGVMPPTIAAMVDEMAALARVRQG